MTSDEVAQTAKRHSKQDDIDTFFGKPVVQAPGTPKTSAIIPFASTPVKKQNLKQAQISTLLKDRRPVAATVDSSAPSGNAAPTVAVDTSAPSDSAAPTVVDSVSSGNATPGFLVLSRGRHDAGEGLWVLDLALFRGGHP